MLRAAGNLMLLSCVGVCLFFYMFVRTMIEGKVCDGVQEVTPTFAS